MAAYWFERVSPQQACEQNQNPIVGDPSKITTLARQLTGTAQGLRTQADRLRAVSTDQFWKGDAAAAFMHLKEKLPPLLDKVVTRYDAVGGALAKYAPDLAAAQQSGARALQAYQDAKAQQQTAQANASQHDQLQQQAQQQHRPFVWTGQDPGQQLGSANQAVANAIRMMADAIDARDATASTCSSRIDDAIHDDLKNDTSLWGKVKHIGKKILGALEKIAPVLRKVAAVLGVAAAVLGWVPVLGEVLAGAALVVGAAALAVDLILKASGKDVSWGDIATDAIGVIPLGRASRLAKNALGKDVVQTALKGVLRGDLAGVGKLVDYGKTIVKNIGPAYEGIADATRSVATGRTTLAALGTNLRTAFTDLGGVKGVVRDVGLPTIALSGKKICDQFLGGHGAPASASAPTDPGALVSGLPVRSPGTATASLVAQPVTLPAAA